MYKRRGLFILSLFLMVLLPAFVLSGCSGGRGKKSSSNSKSSSSPSVGKQGTSNSSSSSTPSAGNQSSSATTSTESGNGVLSPFTQEKTVYSFTGRDGQGSRADLTVYNGNLYGTTTNGGPGNGALFEYNPKTGKESVLHSFGIKTNDGSHPRAALTLYNGNLYGTTAGGGPSGYGTLFEYNLTTGKESVLYSFSPMPGGSYPRAALTVYNGNLYGTAASGGPSDGGTIFEYNLTTGKESVLYTFGSKANDGLDSTGALTVYNGNLYGTTWGGGAQNLGTIFEYNPATNQESVLYSFGTKVNDGGRPQAGLIVYNGDLYGTGMVGGANEGGVIFGYNPKTSNESTLYSFKSGNSNGGPAAALTVYNDNLYGTTTADGANKLGTVFVYSPTAGKESILHNFEDGLADGQYPAAGLTVYNGNLYGTAPRGGEGSAGIIFEIY